MSAQGPEVGCVGGVHGWGAQGQSRSSQEEASPPGPGGPLPPSLLSVRGWPLLGSVLGLKIIPCAHAGAPAAQKEACGRPHRGPRVGQHPRAPQGSRQRPVCVCPLFGATGSSRGGVCSNARGLLMASPAKAAARARDPGQHVSNVPQTGASDQSKCPACTWLPPPGTRTAKRLRVAESTAPASGLCLPPPGSAPRGQGGGGAGGVLARVHWRKQDSVHRVPGSRLAQRHDILCDLSCHQELTLSKLNKN